MEIENSQPTPKKKRGRKPKSETKQNISKSEASSPPCTRSKVAPYWATKESLILVNVISVIEADCLKNLSSYQKWKMIVQHCSALDLHRTLNQCRSRWNSMVTEYNQIKQWDSKSMTASSFWDLDCDKRKEFQLPENFDIELFQAIDDYARAQENDTDTDLDTDSDAETDLLGPIANLGSKRHKRRSISEETVPEGEPRNICELELPQELQAEVGPPKSCEEVNPQMCFQSETPQIQCDEEEPRESHMEVNEEVNPRMCFDSETPQVQCGEEEAWESHLEENEEVKPQMCFESETPQVQYGEEEARESHLEENEVVNPQTCFESETPQVEHVEEEPRESHLEENEEVNPQMCFESETPQVEHGEEEPRESHLEENEEVNPQICFESETPQVQYSEEEPRGNHFEENKEVNHEMCFESETPQVQYSEQGPQKSHLEENPKESCRKENVHIINVEEEPQKSPKDTSEKMVHKPKKKIMGKKEVEEMAVQNLCQNAEMILSVVQGKLPERAEYAATNTNSVQDSQTDFARRQGDSLVACLGNIVSILQRFPYLVHEK